MSVRTLKRDSRQTSPDVRKAAILVNSLDRRSADAMLDQMPPSLAVRVRQAVLELDDVPEEEQNRVIEEFMRMGSLVPSADDGVEIDSSLARKLASGPDEREPVEAKPPEPQPFHFLRDADLPTLIRFLQNEHPQTIAVVVAHLPPQRAADVISHLAEAVQADVLLRVADLDQADSDAIQAIETELETRLSLELESVQKRTASMANVNAILGALGGTERQGVLSQMVRRDETFAGRFVESQPANRGRTGTFARRGGTATLAHSKPQATGIATGKSARPTEAQRPKQKPVPQRKPTEKPGAAIKPVLTFDNVAQLGDSALAATLGKCDPELALLALMGARRPLVDRILRQLPPKEAREVRRKMQQTGPLSMSDVEQAQQHVARVASRLLERGLIHI